MRGGGFPGRAAQGLSLLLYSPGSHGGHIKWPPARAELATNLTPVPPGPGIRRARRGNVTCQKRERFILVGFIWENVAFQRQSTLICLMEINGVFGSMRQILDLPSTPGFCDNKPAGRAHGHTRCGRPIEFLPHTSGIETLPMPPSFQKCGEKLETFDQTAIFDNKTAGKQGVTISMCSAVQTFSPHFRFEVHDAPASSGSFLIIIVKRAASPRRKQPQSLRIDDGKGYFCFGLSC